MSAIYYLKKFAGSTTLHHVLLGALLNQKFETRVFIQAVNVLRMLRIERALYK